MFTVNMASLTNCIHNYRIKKILLYLQFIQFDIVHLSSY